MAFRDVRRKGSVCSDVLLDTPRESGWTVGIAVRNAFSTLECRRGRWDAASYGRPEGGWSAFACKVL
jgi:hypothetical protein